MSNRYRADELVIFPSALLEQAGMARDRARVMADVIVEADLLGHDTHGLDQLAGYLEQIEKGLLATSCRIGALNLSNPTEGPPNG